MLEEQGFLSVSGLLAPSELEPLRDEADRLLGESSGRGGARHALAKSPVFRALAGAQPLALARSILGAEARPTKLTIFDKTPVANWRVPWHQDLTIAVAERRDVEGFGPWSVKDDVPHVEPPVTVLEAIVAIRLHLDDAPASNGALRVLAGTHRRGRLSDLDIDELRQRVSETVCAARAGEALLMRPLLLHASSSSQEPSRRRVLHFEFSAEPLPGGLRWA